MSSMETLFDSIIAEDVPLMARLFFEQGMNVRHLLYDFKKWSLENNGGPLTRYLYSKSTVADVRDFVKRYLEETGKKHLSGGSRKTINEWLYGLPPNLLQWWYQKYGTAFIDLFRYTRPNPKKWKIPWFQEACFGGTVPDDSIIATLRGIRKDGAGHLEDHLKDGINWHYLRQTWPVDDHFDIYLKHGPLRFVIERIGPRLYKGETLDVLDERQLENEELVNTINELVEAEKNLIDVALNRLEGTPRINISVILNVVEDYLTPTTTESQRQLRMRLMDVAQRVLERGFVDEKHIGKAAIIVDKSGSMDKAIDLGITIAGLIANRLPDAKLLFFDTPNEIAERLGIYRDVVPTDIKSMIYLRSKWHASGGTTISSVLKWVKAEGPFDTIFIVSDGMVWDYAEKITMLPRLRQWGATPELMEYVRMMIGAIPPAQWIFVKMPCDTELTVEPNPLGRLLSEHECAGRAITFTPRGAEDAETILGIASYFANNSLMQNVKRIRDDIIGWSDTPKYLRKDFIVRAAIICGKCGGPSPPELKSCLYCGSSVADVSEGA